MACSPLHPWYFQTLEVLATLCCRCLPGWKTWSLFGAKAQPIHGLYVHSVSLEARHPKQAATPGKKEKQREKIPVNLQPLPRYIISSCTMYQFFLKQLYLGAPPQLSEQDTCSAALLCLYQSPPIWILMSHVRIPHPSASLKQAVCPWTIDASFPAYHWATIIESLQLINGILIWAQQFPHGATLTRTSLRWSGLATLTGWRFVHSWHLGIWKSLKAFYHLLSLWVHYGHPLCTFRLAY